MAMWTWTKFAGTSEFALRLPIALIGIALIWLVYSLATAVFNRRTGAIAALLVALNGFDIYWSQTARMYMPSAALAVAATWALVTLMRAGQTRPWLEAGYAALLIAGTQTSELFWAVPMLHLAWAAYAIGPDRAPSWREIVVPWKASALRIVQVQAIALALASAEFVHAVLHARHGAAPDPIPRFLVEYVGFGFLFESNSGVSALPAPPLTAVLAVALAALFLAFAALRARAATLDREPRAALPFRYLAAASMAGAALALVLAAVAPRNREILALFALLPIMCAWLPGLALLVRPIPTLLLPGLTRWIDRAEPFSLLLLLLAFVAPLVFYAASFQVTVTAPRAFMPFAPFLLILVAAGITSLAQSFAAMAGSLVALVALLASSSIYFHDRAISPRDYKAVGGIIAREERAGDVVLVRPSSWSDSPIFYYLPDARYVTPEELPFTAANKPPRIWLARWLDLREDFLDPRPDLLASADYVEAQSWSARNARAALYVRRDAAPRED